jgi:ribose transport system permease protein
VNVFGTLLAAYLLSMINNVLNFLDVSTDYQYIVQGGVIIAAVTMYSRNTGRKP